MGNQAPRENSMSAQGNPPTKFCILDCCLMHPCFLHGTLYLLLILPDVCCPIASSSLISLLQSFAVPLWATDNSWHTETAACVLRAGLMVHVWRIPHPLGLQQMSRRLLFAQVPTQEVGPELFNLLRWPRMGHWMQVLSTMGACFVSQ